MAAQSYSNFFLSRFYECRHPLVPAPRTRKISAARRTIHFNSRSSRCRDFTGASTRNLDFSVISFPRIISLVLDRFDLSLHEQHPICSLFRLDESSRSIVESMGRGRRVSHFFSRLDYIFSDFETNVLIDRNFAVRTGLRYREAIFSDRNENSRRGLR